MVVIEIKRSLHEFAPDGRISYEMVYKVDHRKKRFQILQTQIIYIKNPTK
jgi:hypothetical protein